MMRVAPTQFGSLPSKRMITKRYAQFLGVDFSTAQTQIDDRRSPNAVNLISDAGGLPEKRVGWEVLQTKDGGRVNGLFHLVASDGVARFLAHCGTKLYEWTDIEAGSGTELSTDMADARSTAFTHDGSLYILDGAHYWVYGGNPLTFAAVSAKAFVPTTVVGRMPTGGGVPLEAVNLLTPKRKNSFVGHGGVKETAQLQIYNSPKANGSCAVVLDGNIIAVNGLLTTDSPVGVALKIAGTSFTGWTVTQIGDSLTFTKNTAAATSSVDFQAGTANVLAGIVTLAKGAPAATTLQLDAKNLDDAPVKISVNGGEPTDVPTAHVHRDTGVIDYPTGTPEGGGVDNIVVEFSKTVAGYADRIQKCTIATWFGLGNDSRVFVSGNPEYKNWDWQSGLYDPTYFPDTGYTKIGADSSAIMGYLKQFSTLLIVKQDNEQDATIYQRNAEIDANGVAYFPLKQGVAGVGAVSKYAFATLRDDPLFLAKEGVFATSTAYGGVDQQRITQSRSSLVNARLTHEDGLEDAVSAVWNGLYLLAVNGHCYVADGRRKTGKRDTEDYGYEWFYWTNIPAQVFLEVGGELFFGYADEDGSGHICRFKSKDATSFRFSDGSLYPVPHDGEGKRIETGQAIDAVWASKLDDDGDFMLYKTMPRKGSGVLVKPYSRSSVKVFIRTDDAWDYEARSARMLIFDWEDLDFNEFTFKTNDSPYVVPINSLVKQYKSIQIILRNNNLNEGFGCFGITRRFTAGNYVR